MAVRRWMILALAPALWWAPSAAKSNPLECPVEISDATSLEDLHRHVARRELDGVERWACANSAYLYARSQRSLPASIRFRIAAIWAAVTLDIGQALESPMMREAIGAVERDLDAHVLEGPDRAIYRLAGMLARSDRGTDAADDYSRLLDLARTRVARSGDRLDESFKRHVVARAEIRLGVFRAVRYEPVLAARQFRRAVDATRSWLQLTPEYASSLRRVAEIEARCPVDPQDGNCPLESSRLGLRELLRIAAVAGDNRYGRALRLQDEGSDAQRRQAWGAAMRAFASGAAEMAPDASPEGREFTARLWVAAANAAVLLQQCEEVSDYGGRALTAIEGLALSGLNGPIRVQANTLIAECHLMAGRYAQAWTLAQAQVEGRRAYEADNATLDLRFRFRDRANLEADPREVAMLAGAMRYEGADPRQQAEIFETLVRYSAELRNSSVGDAIILREQRQGATGERRRAIDALLVANARLDDVRRVLDHGGGEAETAFNRAAADLLNAEHAARSAGVSLVSARVAPASLSEALQPGEGLIHFQDTLHGRIAWGIDGSGRRFVVRDAVELPRPGEPYGDALARGHFGNPLHQLTRYQLGRDYTQLSTEMAAGRLAQFRRGNAELPRSPGLDEIRQADPKVAFDLVLRLAGQRFFEPVVPVFARAQRWVLSYGNSLDQMPWAELGFGPDARFGTAIAYSIAPSLEAFLTLRRADVARPSRAAHEFLGVGGIAFTGPPCTAQATQGSTRTAWPADYPAQRERIIAQQCLEGTGDQLAAMAGEIGGGPPTLILGERATEAGLARMRNTAPAVLAIISHAVRANQGFGGAPAILLYPPLRPEFPGDDGRLQPLEAADLAIAADIVILAACATGAPDSDLGEEALAGMTRGFFLGGARSVLTTRWEIRITFARAMNAAFARALAAGMSRAEALRAARRAAAQIEGAQAWDWGAFELVGEGGIMP